MTKKNRTRLLNNLRSRVGELTNCFIFLKGSVLYPEYDSDTHYYPKYEPNFTYLFGLEQNDVDGVIEADTEKTFFIIQNLKEDFYYNNQIDTKTAQEFYGVDAVMQESEFLDYLNQKQIKKIFIHQGIELFTHQNSHVYNNLKILSKFKELNLIDDVNLYPTLNNTRTIKSKEELECMKEICKISSIGHVEIMRKCKVGMREFEIAGLFFVNQKGKMFGIWNF